LLIILYVCYAKVRGPDIAYLFQDMFLKFIQTLLFICSFWGGLSFCHASNSTASPEPLKSLMVWGSDIHYRLLVQTDSRLSFDGKAFIQNVQGRKIPCVVLNTAFFEKEASSLFHRFRQHTTDLASVANITRPELMDFEERLLDSKNPLLPSSSPLTPSLKDSLKKLQTSLEDVAWFQTYQRSLEESSTLEEAERRFVKQFSMQRMKTIEYHEATHLYDMQRSEDIDSPVFKRFTEANAFYAELVYGDNPHDVMAQALAGLLDELNRGEVVDYSVDKVVSILHFLKECPRFAGLMRSGPLQKCCLEMLSKANRNDFIFAGQQLHRVRQQPARPSFASL
jgi:hypothetical protein